MKCPFCEKNESRVVDSRVSKDGKSIRRRRECLACQKRFTTYEYVQEFEIMVIKRDGRREAYDRGKLIKSISTACSKRPISYEKIQQIANEIENRIISRQKTEIESLKIGEYTMKKLKNVDQVAYVRFASVYRDFKDVEEFTNEINKLINKRKDDVSQS
ncbi:MAG: transcriptional regulator NrdR [Candidatus Zixiibacteriota bacterium]